jgi:hypothetical protein
MGKMTATLNYYVAQTFPEKSSTFAASNWGADTVALPLQNFAPVLLLFGCRSQKYLKIVQYLLPLALSIGLSASIAFGAGNAQTATPSPFVSEVEAWAMLFQMMGRVHVAVEKRDSSLLDGRSIADAAVSSYLPNSPSAQPEKQCLEDAMDGVPAKP